MKVLLGLSLTGVFGGVVVEAATESSATTRQLDQTPTWAVASVCAVIIIISILLEKILHKVGTWFTEKHKQALFEALEKVKAELMILGFISLLLTFGQYNIAKICVPQDVAGTMLPCKKQGVTDKSSSTKGEEEPGRRLLWFDRRFLAGAKGAVKCKDGYEQLITVDGLHQLHILIFFLACFHVLFSVITMTLGRLKTRAWKRWELETLSHDYEFSNDPSRFRLTHETSFVRSHTSFWTRIPFFFYVGCFIRQFFISVSKSDYLTLRNGFITVHLAPGSKFNFQKYIKRSLEDDFKLVVGVSPVLWASFVIFLLLNVNGLQALFWASIIPVIIILAVGTKLQAILTMMALEITDRHAVVQGMPLVQASDKYFWFGRPQLLLHLIHFALFQNAFQITYFLWIWYSFGLKSCFHANFDLVIAKVALGVGALILCSYITLPLYALVTQMGSRMKKSVFDDQTSKALKKWHMLVKKRHAKGGKTPSRTLGSVSPSVSSVSSAHALQRFKTTGHSTRSSYTFDDQDESDLEAEASSPTTATTSFIVRMDDDDDDVTEVDVPRQEEETTNEDDFSFAKPAPPKKP
ncbi:MLO-like protein 10 isoform X1 [Populus nigra]|uniref:MLO-like protein 10 isoform X1 n=2 Tax=Populus nigra TaxID=3691 RepID=UPI002B26FF1B|nr:MLO-like protein 10 isoform X1 [Populus nigra]XP_061948949.1 MLO-like protein 10 isoform X1 [Populus nigra]